MDTISKSIYLHVISREGQEPYFHICESPMSNNPDWHLIGEKIVSFNVEDINTYLPGQIKTLEAHRERLRVKSNEEIMALDAQIGQLLALENDHG